LRIGIDTGGTFTDIVAVDGSAGTMRVTKVASTPANPAIGLVRGVREILDAAGASANDVAGLAHGTTVATNALLRPPILAASPPVSGGRYPRVGQKKQVAWVRGSTDTGDWRNRRN
jgi:N-methylhydantoinase A